MINQYSSPTKQETKIGSVLNNVDDFPALPSRSQRRYDYFDSEIIDEIINTLTLRMEKIIEESTIRIFNSIMQKINRIEKSLSSNKHLTIEQATDPESEEEEPEQINNTQTTTTKIKPSSSSGASNHSKSNAQTTSNVSTELLNDEQSAGTTKKIER